VNGEKIVGSSQRRRFGVLLHQTSLKFRDNSRELAKNIVHGFQNRFSIKFKDQDFTDAEKFEIDSLIREKYTLDNFNCSPGTAPAVHNP